MAPGPTLLVIQHAATCPLDRFEGWLTDAGCRLEVRRGYRGEAIPSTPEGYDGLLVLGGPMGAYDDDAHPWLGPVKRLIVAAIDAACPMLGICLGQQLATVALGGSVVRNPHGRASGLTPVALTPAGREDRLLGGISPGSAAVQWNSDIAQDVAGGAVVLASSPDGSPQAIRFGPVAWGVQFHPEVSPAIFRSWITSGAGSPGDPSDRAALREVQAADDELRRTWEPLATRFADVCREFAARAGR